MRLSKEIMINSIPLWWQRLAIGKKMISVFGGVLVLVFAVWLTILVTLISVHDKTDSRIKASANIKILVSEIESILTEVRFIHHLLNRDHAEISAIDSDKESLKTFDRNVDEVIKKVEQLQYHLEKSEFQLLPGSNGIDQQPYVEEIKIFQNLIRKIADSILWHETQEINIHLKLQSLASKIDQLIWASERQHLVVLFRDIQIVKKDFWLNTQNTSSGFLLESLSKLENAVINSDLLVVDKNSILTHLNQYRVTSNEIYLIHSTIKGEIEEFENQIKRITVVSAELNRFAQNDAEDAEAMNARLFRWTWIILLLSGLLGFGLMALMVYLINFSITRNVIKLGKAAREIKKGNLKAKADINSEDELGQLGDAFNSMTEQLDSMVDALEHQVNENTLQLKERVKELSCLYQIAELIVQPKISLEELFQQTVESIPPSWQFPDVTCARIEFEGQRFATDNFEQSRWNLSEKFYFQGTVAGKIDVNYLKELPGLTEDPFLKEERNLLNAIANLLENAVERKKVEEDLTKAKIEAEAANRAKSKFLANMNHELRTPLNAIMGYSQLMQRQSELSEKEKIRLAIITRSGKHLLELINQVLDLAKIESGITELNESNFNLQTLLENLVQTFKPQVRDKGIGLVLRQSKTMPIVIKADEQKLRQILFNLLSNAVKFTEKGSITLNVDCETNDENLAALRFSVKDTGAGIGPDEIDKLFKSFSQTQTGKSKPEGAGLGLVISREFVRMMGGNLAVESSPGEGSVFSFGFMVQISDPGKAKPDLVDSKIVGLKPGQKKYRILVVEDNYQNQLLLVQLLSNIGFEVETANDGEEGAEKSLSWQPHLILMDMKMPNMSGYEATSRIKKNTSGQKPIIIAVTAVVFEEEKKDIYQAGCDAIVRKPIQFDQLLETIGDHLNLKFVYNRAEEYVVTDVNKSGLEEEDYEKRINKLPQPLLRELKSKSLELNREAIGSLLKEIADVDDGVTADYLANLVENYEFDKISAMIHLD